MKSTRVVGVIYSDSDTFTNQFYQFTPSFHVSPIFALDLLTFSWNLSSILQLFLQKRTLIIVCFDAVFFSSAKLFLPPHHLLEWTL